MTTVSVTSASVKATPKIVASCHHCGVEIVQAGTGRPKRFCSAVCKKALARTMKALPKPAEVSMGVVGSVPAVAEGQRRVCEPTGPAQPGLNGASKIETKRDTTFPQVSEFRPIHDPEYPQVSEFRPAAPSWYYAKIADFAGQSQDCKNVINIPSSGSEPPHSWANATFETAARVPILGRRGSRHGLRSLLREVTSVDRCRGCGREIIGGVVMAKINAEVAHFAGVETCARIWLCPVCSAKIRLRRGEDVAEGASRWLSLGGGVYFLTCTLPHEHGDALEASLGTLTRSWRYLTSGTPYQVEKARLGYVGNIKSIEVTHGRHGWHPHAHCVLCTQRPLTMEELQWWYARLDARWARALVRHGWPEGQAPYRLRLDMVNRDSVAGLAAYVTKLQDGRGLGNEIARADLKNGKGSSRTPFQILADFGTWGDAADLALWHEYEAVTAGVHAIQWSRGLRGLLLPDSVEQTDAEIAAEEIGGEDVCAILPRTWYQICDTPGAETLVLRAIEQGGMQAVIRVLTALRIDPSGVLSPQEWVAGQA